MSAPPDVVLLRSPDDPDPYVEAFAEVGLRATCVPVLTFVFPHQEVLETCLRHRDRYAGLIATSPRVSIALDRVFGNREALREQWRGAPAYAVGPKTAKRLREVGMQPRGADAGTADTLADKIVDLGANAPLLFLCGNRRRDALPDRLRAASVPFEELVVYRTETRTDIELPPAEEGAWLVFFSPSGVEAVGSSPAADLERFWIAAIGPTTAGAVETTGLSVEAVAEEPSPTGLVTAIHRAAPEK